MKTIELTNKHKSKLLEMCNKLFPKEGKWFEILCGNIYYSKNGKFPGKSIHWFEFCITHLCDKISTKLTNEMCVGMPQYYDESEKLDWNSQSLISMLKEYHPIDYLYEEFKKLEKYEK